MLKRKLCLLGMQGLVMLWRCFETQEYFRTAGNCSWGFIRNTGKLWTSSELF